MGTLQNEDFKTEAQLTGAGGAKSQLLNDVKIYIGTNSINETLDDALSTAKLLITPQIATPAATSAGYNRIYPKAGDSWYTMNSGGTEKTVVDNSNSVTLTNKTIAGGSNTISGLTHGSQVDNPTSGVHGVTGSVVGTSDAQVLTEKDFDGGTASNTSRVTLPKAATATLSGLTRKQGTVAYDTTLNKVVFDDGSVLTAVGTGSGSGVPNYITNFDAETDTSGWTLFDDGAVSTPVNGTGGSPSTLTLTRTTTAGEVLSGDASFKLSKSAADGQGEGVSYDFVIPRAGAATQTRVTFDYQVIGSFSYANNDIVSYLFDVDTNALIQPTPYLLDGSGHAFLDFQTNSNASTNYRLIFMIATTNATAYDFIFDNVVAYASNAAPQGLTQDTQYDLSAKWTGSPALSSVTGSKGVPYKTKDGVWRLIFNATFVQSATSSVTLTLDGVGFKTGYKQAVAFSFDSYTGGPPAMSQAFTNSGAATIIISASSTFTGFEVSGDVELDSKPSWAVDYYPVQFNSDIDGRVTAALIMGDPASASSGNPIIVPTVSYDSHGAYNATTGRYTCPLNGIYKVFGALQSASSATTLTVYVDAVSTSLAGNLGSNGEATFNTAVKVSAGQIIDLRPGGTVDATNMALNFERVSGPALPIMGEKVFMQATGDAASASSGNPIIFPTSTYDSHAGYSVSTGRYTIPSAGVYKVYGYLNSANSGVQVNIYKNASSYSALGSTDSNGECSYAGAVYCYANDIIDIRPNGTIDVGTVSTLCIDKL